MRQKLDKKIRPFIQSYFKILSDEFSSGFYFLTKKEKTKEFMFMFYSKPCNKYGPPLSKGKNEAVVVAR